MSHPVLDLAIDTNLGVIDGTCSLIELWRRHALLLLLSHSSFRDVRCTDWLQMWSGLWYKGINASWVRMCGTHGHSSDAHSPCAQDEDGRSDGEPEESDGGAASGFVVSDGHLSASEVRDDLGMDVDDGDGDLDGEAPTPDSVAGP